MSRYPTHPGAQKLARGAVSRIPRTHSISQQTNLISGMQHRSNMLNHGAHFSSPQMSPQVRQFQQWQIGRNGEEESEQSPVFGAVFPQNIFNPQLAAGCWLNRKTITLTGYIRTSSNWSTIMFALKGLTMSPLPGMPLPVTNASTIIKTERPAGVGPGDLTYLLEQFDTPSGSPSSTANIIYEVIAPDPTTPTALLNRFLADSSATITVPSFGLITPPTYTKYYELEIEFEIREYRCNPNKLIFRTSTVLSYKRTGKFYIV